MLQLTQMWTGISLRQQIVIGVTTLGMFLGVFFMARTSLAPDMVLLYSGLDAAAAGEVVSSLEQQGVKHEVRGGSIYVENTSRDRLRLVLASEGLPSNTGAGYELLDGLSGFGTTSQMFDAAYWRAKEGELARTIMASPNIRAARVHIARANPRPFQQGSDSAASVSVTPKGSTLSTGQARALRFLVASAVAGLEPDAVTIIDGRTGMLIEGADALGGVASAEKSLTLKRNVTRLVEAHVGMGNAVVEVNVEHVSERETLVERRFDPEGRVVISTESTEKTRANEGGGAGSGTVSVASNLPDGDANGTGGAGTQSSSENENREVVNFEVSQTTREVLRTPGAIKRISVAVLVNGIPTEDANGNVTLQDRPAEELEALEQLVASAVGFDASRGDTVTIKSMNLDRTAQLLDENELTESSGFQGLDLMQLIQVAVLAAVALILGLFVVRPILKPAPQTAALPSPGVAVEQAPSRIQFAKVQHQSPEIAGALTTSTETSPAATIMSSSEDGPVSMATATIPNEAPADEFEFPAMAAVDTAFVDPNAMISDGESGETGESHDAVIHLRQLILSQQVEALEVLRGWLDHDQTDETEAV